MTVYQDSMLWLIMGKCMFNCVVYVCGRCNLVLGRTVYTNRSDGNIKEEEEEHEST